MLIASPAVRRILSVAVLAALPAAAAAQTTLESVIVEAESGALGSEFAFGLDSSVSPPVNYIFPTTNLPPGPPAVTQNPGTVNRVVTYSVTFPAEGTWELYARVRVGPAGGDDDSMYYGNGFGIKTVTLSGSGSDGQWVADLDNGLPGTTQPPPPPYVPPGPPLALDKPKFLGSVSSPSQNLNFNAYFNQVSPENGGKWGSVEGARDVMNWDELDAAYNLAKNNRLKAPGDPRDGMPYPLPFRLHTLVWGNQQPNWIAALPPAEQLEEIAEWFSAVAGRYPQLDFVEVVNEALHDPPDDPADGGYMAALGGSGGTGWDWVIKAFELARERFPNSRLGINEYSVTNDGNLARRYLEIINLLKARGLIDWVGVQGHAFSTRVPAATTRANLDLLATTGLPIYVTELDVDGSTDEGQLADYQRIFPAFWEHPAVRGITLWGYRPGMWRTAEGAYLVLENGAERPAMHWLKGYVPATALSPWITANPVPVADGGDSVSFSCAGGGSEPRAYQWRKDGAEILGNASAVTPTVTLEGVRTADAGQYDCVVSNATGSATSAAATLSVQKAVAAVVLGDLFARYDGGPHAVSVTTFPAGLRVVVTYDGSLAPPTAPGAYAVVATVDDPDYVGQTLATLVIVAAALVRHAPAINGTLDGSLQVLLPESAALNGANGNASVSAFVVAPEGAVHLSGTLHGGVVADRLVINGGGVLSQSE